VSSELLFQQALNGLSFGALLFILAAGLSLVFGMMDVVNLAHGAFYMLGAYLALSVVQLTGSFWVAMLAAPLALGLLGLILEPLLLRRLRGGDYPVYRLFVIGLGIALAALVTLVYRRTALGMHIRAGVEDAQMLGALGVDIDRLFALTFAAGAALAGLAGVVAAPVFGLQPGMDVDALLYSLVVVVVGGLGTLGGAVVGSVLIGPADTFGKVLFQEFALAVIFAIVALVLLLRPTGLLGRIRIAR